MRRSFKDVRFNEVNEKAPQVEVLPDQVKLDDLMRRNEERVRKLFADDFSNRDTVR